MNKDLAQTVQDMALVIEALQKKVDRLEARVFPPQWPEPTMTMAISTTPDYSSYRAANAKVSV